MAFLWRFLWLQCLQFLWCRQSRGRLKSIGKQPKHLEELSFSGPQLVKAFNIFRCNNICYCRLFYWVYPPPYKQSIHFHEPANTDLHFPLSQGGGFAQFSLFKKNSSTQLASWGWYLPKRQSTSGFSQVHWHPSRCGVIGGDFLVRFLGRITLEVLFSKLWGITPLQNQHDDLKGNTLLVTSRVWHHNKSWGEILSSLTSIRTEKTKRQRNHGEIKLF